MIGISVVIVLINIITCTVFEKIVFLERRHTVNDETIGQFQKITIMQFVNIALVILLVNFSGLTSNLLGFIPILQGEYHDFSQMWYNKVGSSIIFTLLINIFSPHLSKLAQPMLKGVARCWDRRWCNCKIKNKKPSPGGLDVNTNKTTQTDLNNLYTGS